MGGILFNQYHRKYHLDTVRLVGGSTKYEGRLEIYNRGAWGTVCDDNLSNELSAVVCRSLRLPW